MDKQWKTGLTTLSLHHKRKVYLGCSKTNDNISIVNASTLKGEHKVPRGVAEENGRGFLKAMIMGMKCSKILG